MNKNLVIRGGAAIAASADVALLHGIAMAINDQPPVQAALAGRVFSTESALNSEEQGAIQIASSNLQATLQSVVNQLNLADANKTRVLTTESAAVQGFLAASNPSTFVARENALPPSGPNMHVLRAEGVPNYLGHRSKVFALEAFNNQETRNALIYTFAYNYTASRQNEFGETVWPTLTLPADQVGFGIVVNRLCIHRGVTHTVDGAAVDFHKVDLMRAGVDPTILRRDKTRLYPIVRPAAADKFVDAALVAPALYNNEGVEILTAPLRCGVEVGLIGISQTDAALQAGSANQTDSLDPAISVEDLIVKIGEDVISIKAYGTASANFTYAPQGLDKQRNLTFQTKSVRLNKKTTRVDGTPLVTLADIVADELTLVLEMHATGTANTEFATGVVYGNLVKLLKILDKDGNVLAATSATAQDLQAAFATASIIGWTPRAYKSNLNMNERGDFIDRTSFTQLYEVPLLSPVTAQRPQNSDGQQDASDFESLVVTTRFRLQNDAVTAIFDRVNVISAWTEGAHTSDEIPAELGAARYHVKPVCYTPEVIDVSTIVDSWNSSTRLADLQAAIVNQIRDYAFKMYIMSEYQSATDAMGMEGPATVIIATDQYLHRYIMLDGDLRTLTEKFNIKVVSTTDRRFRGRLFMTFGVFDENRNQAPNILNWGNLVWAPEVVLSASVPRGERLSKETIVHPRYLFVNHLPVCAMLSFTNIPATLNKLPVNFKDVT